MSVPDNRQQIKQHDKRRREAAGRKAETPAQSRVSAPEGMPLARAKNVQGTPPAAGRHESSLARNGLPGQALRREGLLSALQQSYGNRYVQRLVDGADSPGNVSGLPGAATADGRALEQPVKTEMEDRFKTSFGGVRLHTGSSADQDARALGAKAFTSGQDVYFRGGAYQPGTAEGKHLLAHELTHTIQQRGLPAGAQPALDVIPQHDASEQQAERVAEAVARGADSGPIAPLSRSFPTPALMIQRRPAAAPPASPKTEAAPAKTGTDANGDFTISLAGLTFKREELDRAKSKGKFTKDLSALHIPGLTAGKLELDIDKASGMVKKGRISATPGIPFVRKLGRGNLEINIDKDGNASLTAKAQLEIAALNNPEIELGVKDNSIFAEVALDKIKVSDLRRLKTEAKGSVQLRDGKLNGNGQVSLEYRDLAKGQFSLSFNDGVPEGKGRVELIPDYLRGTEATLAMVEGRLSGEATIPAAKLKPPIPGFTISDGTISLAMQNRELSGKGEKIVFSYNGLGSGTIDFSIAKDHLEGGGQLTLQIPGLAPIDGSLNYSDGRLSGSARITPDKFPKGLPIKGGSIMVGVDDKAQISGKGDLKVDLFGVGKGELRLGYEKGVLDIGADVELTKIPGLEAGKVHIGLKDGKLEGEGEIGVAPKQIPGLSGTLLAAYKDDRFSGKAKLGYAKEKFSGEVELLLNQDEKGKLAISGSGEVNARLTDWLTGKVHIDVLPDATTKIQGELKADDIELFPEKKADKELFNISKNIPLWAILVAVIKVRGGVRAGVGPGKLRGVTAEGQFSTGAGEQPSFKIHGELFIPAYAEAYLAFGAGLGLDVVLGSLTGGIEAVGTAGVYGAVSVIPEIEYDGADYSISGTATLAAAAKLKLGLQAWAQVEALWVTVWSNEWKLAEWVWDVGPTLALQADMKYVFGKPEPPTLDFKTSDIDAEKLVQDAMPKDGVKGSGAREALQNTADWKGKLKEQKKDASKIPPDLADQQSKTPKPKDPPAKPAKKAPPAEAKPKDPNKIKEEAAKELKDKAAPDKSKPGDKAHQEKYDKGMTALQNLADKSKDDPEDSKEIDAQLKELKSTHGFTTLTHRLQGDQWVVEAAMSEPRKFYFVATPIHPEELVGGKTYGQLKGTSGITPDHEPQNALMTYISGDDFKFEKNGKKTNIKPFPKNSDILNYTHGTGICLSMDSERHKVWSRTWGPYGKATKEDAIGKIKQEWDAMPDYTDTETTREEARKRVVRVVRGQLDEDHTVVRKLYDDARYTSKTPNLQKRVDDGLKAVVDENEKRYSKAFKE